MELNTWQFQSVLLGFEHLQESYIVVFYVLRRFQITSHIRAMTTDNTSFNTKILGLLQDSLPGFSQQDGQIRCMAHINLAVQQILSHLNVVLTENTTYIEEEADNSTGYTAIDKAFSYACRIISKIQSSNKL